MYTYISSHRLGLGGVSHLDDFRDLFLSPSLRFHRKDALELIQLDNNYAQTDVVVRT